MKAIRLVKIDFDVLENNDPFRRKEIAYFISDVGGVSAHGKVEKYINNLPEVKFYLGWDGQVYPKYELENVELE